MPVNGPGIRSKVLENLARLSTTIGVWGWDGPLGDIWRGDEDGGWVAGNKM